MSKAFLEKLSRAHHVSDFDCGEHELNKFLQKHALQNQQSNSSQTYVAIMNDNIIGYYSLSVGAVEHIQAPGRMTKGQGQYPVPLMIIARLAVNKKEQRGGVGKGLLKDALLRTIQAADIAGIRAVVVHAKNNTVKKWYKQFGFEPSPTDPLHLYLLMKDIKKILK